MTGIGMFGSPESERSPSANALPFSALSDYVEAWEFVAASMLEAEVTRADLRCDSCNARVARVTLDDPLGVIDAAQAFEIHKNTNHPS